jgi:hypothetical protein
MRRQPKGFNRLLGRDAANFKEDAARFNYCHPMVVGRLAAAHSGLGWFLANGLVGKDSNPYLPASLEVAGDGDTSGFDLSRSYPVTTHRLQPKLAKMDAIARGGDALAPTSAHFPVLGALWL